MQFQHDVIGHSTAISASEKGQEWKVVLGFLAEMRQGRLRPDVITYSSAMCASDKGPAVEGGVVAFGRDEAGPNAARRDQLLCRDQHN